MLIDVALVVIGVLLVLALVTVLAVLCFVLSGGGTPR